jgi:putative membrane protein
MIEISEKKAYGIIAAISLAVVLLIGWLTYVHSPGTIPDWARSLPGLNASFNFLSACSLLMGYASIRAGDKERHLRFMLLALTFTFGFLVSYLAYHVYAGDTHFGGEGWIRSLYFFILISHVSLSIINFPLALTVVFFSTTGRLASHKRLARITLPIWLYVSVTGVAVYYFLRPYRG